MRVDIDHLCWFEVGEATLVGLDSVIKDMDKVKLISESLKTNQSH